MADGTENVGVLILEDWHGLDLPVSIGIDAMDPSMLNAFKKPSNLTGQV